MKSASVSELKKSLSSYLARVKSGEEVLITDRGTAIARIVPMERSGRRRIPPYLLELEKAGKLRIGSGRLPSGFWDWDRPADPQSKARRALELEREKGR